MSYHMKPSSVTPYLSGIQNQLELYFFNIHKIHTSYLVSKTMRSCKHLCSSAVKCKSWLEATHMQLLVQTYGPSDLHDDCLFSVQVTSGFSTLNYLKELVWPDSKNLQSYQTLPLCHSITWSNNTYTYTLPCTKTDQVFKGNCIVVQKNNTAINPFSPFLCYLSSCNTLFPDNPELWLCSNGSVPTCKWFLHHLHHHFPPHISGQSICSRGTTALILAGVSNDTIQAAGRWSSDAFQAYICKNAFLLQALVWGRPALQAI